MNRAPSPAGALLVLALVATPVLAQEPRVGRDWYEDNVDLGFKIKVPSDWDFIPPQPLEANLVGKYAPPGGLYVNLGGDAIVFLEMWLVKFDRRPEKDGEHEREVAGETVRFSAKGASSIESWMSDEITEGTAWRIDDKYPKDLKGPKVEARYSLWTGMSSNGRAGAEPQEIKAYVAEFQLAEDLDLALVGIGPGNKQWRAFEKAYSKMAKSLQTVEVEAIASAGETASPRGKKRAKLHEEVIKNPGWELYETPSYFIISSYNDKQFIEELMERLEAIRAVFEEDYPAEKARMIERKSEDDEPEARPAGAGGEKGEGSDEDRTISVVNPLELSRTSVVRVCKDVDEYHKYGGPQGTGGYWSWVDEELVIYDDRARRGTDWTWSVLSHEAFHQYIFYFYGNIAPHSWYNEGTGDYYSGFEYKRKKFHEKAENGRLRAVQKIMGEKRYVPLEDFVRWTKSQYYGDDKNGPGAPERGLEGHECYALGWSLIWFLRTGEKKAKGWDDDWNSILDVYLETLAETGEVDDAVDAAFDGVDWEAFEKAWLDYIG